MRRLAVVNQKGGVGKTTITLHLAAALSTKGLRVLVVDLDPQGYATAGAGLLDRYDTVGPNLSQLLLEDLAVGVEDLVCPTADGFDLLPSNLDMTVTEPQMYAARGREFRLRKGLEPIADQYDYILIDCPASLGVLTDNAVVAAGEVLVPMLPDGLSLRALELLLDQIVSIREGLGVDVQICGLVLNQYAESKVTQRVEEDLARIPVPVLARIRKRVAVSNAWEEGRTLVSAEPGGHIALAMQHLADTVIAQTSSRAA